MVRYFDLQNTFMDLHHRIHRLRTPGLTRYNTLKPIYMRFTILEYEFNFLKNKYPQLENWKLGVHHKKQTLGLTSYINKTISFGKYSLFYDDLKINMNTLKHEVAHVLAGSENGHNQIWKKCAINVGADPKSCSVSDIETKYVMTCDNDCFNTKRHNKLKKYDNYVCSKCKGKIHHINNYKYVKIF
jgi:predicted SprT family Zn-dependent metalloprotease